MWERQTRVGKSCFCKQPQSTVQSAATRPSLVTSVYSLRDSQEYCRVDRHTHPLTLHSFILLVHVLTSYSNESGAGDLLWRFLCVLIWRRTISVFFMIKAKLDLAPRSVEMLRKEHKKTFQTILICMIKWSVSPLRANYSANISLYSSRNVWGSLILIYYSASPIILTLPCSESLLSSPELSFNCLFSGATSKTLQWDIHAAEETFLSAGLDSCKASESTQ